MKHNWLWLVIAVALLTPQAGQTQELDKKADVRMRRVVKILRTTNKAQVNQFVPVAFELRNVNPYAVIRFVRRVIEVEEGNWWTFVHPDGDKGRLLVNVPLWQVEPLTELVSLIDREGLTSSSGSKKAYVRLKHRNPSDIGFLNAVGANLTDTGKLRPDAATGALYIEDAPSGTDAAVALLEEIDAPTKQVILRCKIYEIDVVNDGTMGLDFHAWKNGPGRNLFALQAGAEYFFVDRSAGFADQFFQPGLDVHSLQKEKIKNYTYGEAYFYNLPSAYFDYLVSKGKARILTAPRATVMNTEVASFSTGEEILYYRVANGPTDLGGVRPVGVVLNPNGDDIRFPDNRSVNGDTLSRVVTDVVEAGVFLELRPVIADGDGSGETVNLDVAVAAVSQLGFDDAGVPMLSSRDVNTRIRATAGKEYLIGGLTRTRRIQTTRKVPILGSLPIIGYLFGGEITTNKKTMLAISITAEVIGDDNRMNDEESEVIRAVNNEKTMEDVKLPETPVGFDMYLLNKFSDR